MIKGSSIHESGSTPSVMFDTIPSKRNFPQGSEVSSNYRTSRRGTEQALAAMLVMLVSLFPIRSDAQTSVVVDDLLTTVQQTLIRVQDAIDEDDLPELSKVTLNLKSVLKKEATGGVSLYIVEFGSGVERESILQLSLELEPPQYPDSSPVAELTDLLANAIIEAVRAVNRATGAEPPLHLNKLTATVRFVVQADSSAGINFS